MICTPHLMICPAACDSFKSIGSIRSCFFFFLLSFRIDTLEEKTFGFISFCSGTSQIQIGVYSKSEAIFFSVRRTTILHTPVFRTCRGYFKIQAATVREFVTFLFGFGCFTGLCREFVADVSVHFGGIFYIEPEVPRIMPHTCTGFQ